MKVWEFAEALLLTDGRNPRVIVEIETEDLKDKYGIAGINGRLNDVPAWLGNCDIIRFGTDVLVGNDMKYTIYL